MLRSLGKIPCEEVCSKLVQCLKENPKEMCNCIFLMDNYRTCAFKEAIAKFNDKDDK